MSPITESGRRRARAVRGMCMLAFVGSAWVFAGCAGQRLYDDGKALLRQGQVDEGLSRMEQAIRQEPSNAQYRIGLSVERATVIQRMFAQADAARREERSADAERGYRAVLRLDPNHAMSLQGLALLAQETRHRALVVDAEALFRQGGLAQAGAALDRLRTVLTADPRNKSALKLKEQIEDAQTREQSRETGLAENFRRPITLQFNDAPLRTIFDAISRISGLNFFFDKDVRPDARGTILASRTTVEDAVRLLLLTNQLEQKVLNDSSVLIYPNTAQKQKDYQTLIVRSFYLANADVKAVSSAIKAIVKTKDLVVDERLGTILMRDTADAVRVAERIVALQDMVDPEVMLEVEVLEVKRSRLQELGIQWPGQLTLTPLPATGAKLADLLNLSQSSVGAAMSSAGVNINKQDQDANILSNPRIRVRNREKARILIGDRIPVITSTTSGTASFLSESVSYLDVGLKLEVEPTIYLDDDVAIKINLEVSSLVKEVVSKNGTLTYQIGTRGASTVLRLKDGETQVLAGLISDEERASGNKIPGLGDLPLMGRLFGSQKDDDQRSEIMLSITPRVLRSLLRPPLVQAEFESGTESAVGAPPVRLRRLDAGAEGVASTTPAGRTAASTARPATSTPEVRSSLPPAGFAALAPAPAGGAARLQWQGPAQVKAGQVFTVLLRGTGMASSSQLLLDIGYDPRAVELLEVRAGALFDPADGNGSLLQQGNAGGGQLRVTLARPDVAEGVAATPRPPETGPPLDLLALSFKALASGPQGASTSLRLRQADAQPAPAGGIGLPAELGLRVLP